MRNYLIGIAFCLLVLNINLFSQIVLEGTVRTPGMDPEPVQNALVELIDQADTTRVFSSTTNNLGYYSIQITKTGIGDIPSQKPGAFNLVQNYPNPFNPSTVITYELPHPADIRIEIFNVLGQKIKTLYDGFQSNSFGRVIWVGTNDLGQGVSAGVYIYSLTAEGIRINKKMLLLDGHPDISNIAYSSTMGGISSNKNVLNKPLSNTFLLRLSGTDIETWEQHDLQITSNMVLDITVFRTETDIDGNVYKIVKIGHHWWMAENLKVTKYRNGDAIPYVTGNSDWTNLTTGAFCYYDNDINYALDYGALYNWYAVNDSRNIAPEGWHVPTDEEWKHLEMHLGMSQSQANDTNWRGLNEGGKMKETGTTHWNNPNEGATNESGFSALPGGYRVEDSGSFRGMGIYAGFWSSTEYDNRWSIAWYRCLVDDDASVFRYYHDENFGISVRCVRDDSTLSLVSIEIIPKADTLNYSKTRQFKCTATYTDSSTRDVTNLATWSVSPGTAGSIDASGLFTASDTLTGLETITATYLGKKAQASATVIARETGTVTDIDGNVYQTVKIGNQWWMAENLKVTRYRNGEAIPNVTGNTEWGKLKTCAYCYYDNSSSNATVYGALYNWYAVNDNRNIAPAGWHVSTDEEWKQLEMHLGMSQSEANDTEWRGTNEGGKLKETEIDHWNWPNLGATNQSGFTALPGGCRSGVHANGSFTTLSENAYFWSSTEYDYWGWYRGLYYSNAYVFRGSRYKEFGFSVRCVRDDSTLSLHSIEIIPTADTLNNSETRQFTCTATYTDSSTRDVTNLATWSVSPGTAGSIDANGLFTAHDTNIGTETITATYLGQTDQVTVTVLKKTGTVTDIDGNTYRTIKIGDQWWMAENLKVTRYRNGDDIPNVTGRSEWVNLTTGAYCYYDNSSSNAAVYGALYNWYALNDSRNIAPAGWHVPSDEEWQSLVDYLGSSSFAGGKLKETGPDYWNSPNLGATNESGFTALPGGCRYPGNDNFTQLGDYAYFWSSTEDDDYYVWHRALYYYYSGVYRNLSHKLFGFSVRLVRD